MGAPVQPPLIVTTATAGYAHWLTHLKRNLALFNLDRLLRVCAADAEATALATRLGISIVEPHTPQNASGAALFKLNTGRTPGTFMSASWKAAVHYKQHCVWTLLETLSPGAHLLLVDGDVSFFQNPLPELLPTPGENATLIDDIQLLDDTVPRSTEPYLNSGFMMLRNTAATRQFGRAYLAQLSRRRGENDQNVFNDVLRLMSTTGPLAGRPVPRSSGRRLEASSVVDSLLSKGAVGTRAGGKAGSSKAGSTSKAGVKAGGPSNHALLAFRGGGKASGTPSSVKSSSATKAALPKVVAKMMGGGAHAAHGSGRVNVRHGIHGGGLRVRALDPRRFSNGFFFYEYRHKRPLNTSALVAVHHNWIRGDRNKWERAVAYDAVVREPDVTQRQFLKRARTSMVSMRAWEYRNMKHPGNRPE